MVEMKICRNSNILPLITLTLKITENPNHVEMKMSKTQKFVYMYLSRLVKTSGKCEIKCEGSFTPPIFPPTVFFLFSPIPSLNLRIKGSLFSLKVRSEYNYLQIQMSNSRPTPFYPHLSLPFLPSPWIEERVEDYIYTCC